MQPERVGAHPRLSCTEPREPQTPHLVASLCLPPKSPLHPKASLHPETPLLHPKAPLSLHPKTPPSLHTQGNSENKGRLRTRTLGSGAASSPPPHRPHPPGPALHPKAPLLQHPTAPLPLHPKASLLQPKAPLPLHPKAPLLHPKAQLSAKTQLSCAALFSCLLCLLCLLPFQSATNWRQQQALPQAESL